MTNIDYTNEWIKCKLNPLYFIYKYVKVPVVGDFIPITFDNTLPKHRAYIKAVHRLHNVVILGSRRSYKTTFALLYALWASLFYSNYKAVIINYRKTTAKENLAFIKQVYKHLPDFLKVPLKWKGEKLEYIEFVNNSKIEIMVPASNVDPSTIGRGLNVPLVVFDEAAFVNGASEIWTAMQPALRSAREQAIKNNYPYAIIVISTPNGREGKGKFFYELWTNSTPIDELYDLNKEKWLSDNPNTLFREILNNNPFRNTFIGIKIHWSEFPQYDEQWYEEQKRELGYYTSVEGRRRVNQELDLLFLGSENSLFPDEVLEQFQPRKPINELSLSYGAKLKLFNELNKDDYYIIGIDTAKSVTGDYSAIEIFNQNFEQVGELQYRFGSVDKFTDVIKQIVNYLLSDIQTNKFKLIIENNSYGNQVVETLLNDTSIDYSQYMYYEEKKNTIVYGVTTTGKSKQLIIDALYQKVVENPLRIKSQELITEMHYIELKNNGRIEAQKGKHDDLFMASSFAAYGLNELVKRFEIVLDEEQIKQQEQNLKKVISNINLVDPIKDIKPKEQIINDNLNNNFEEGNNPILDIPIFL